MAFSVHVIWLAAVDFLYPSCCAVCGRLIESPSGVLCPVCADTIQPLTAPYCERCSSPLSHIMESCDVCAGRTFHFTSARTATVFDESIQRMIHLLKYRRRRYIGHYLGEMLGKTVVQASWFAHIDILIPMPLHRTRMRERGYNQSEYVAQGVSAVTQRPVHTRLVERTRPTRSQTTLTPEERKTNVHGAFRVIDAGMVSGKHIALVDDVLTTGSTFDSCARVLLAGGAAAVYALAVARA